MPAINPLIRSLIKSTGMSICDTTETFYTEIQKTDKKHNRQIRKNATLSYLATVRAFFNTQSAGNACIFPIPRD